MSYCIKYLNLKCLFTKPFLFIYLLFTTLMFLTYCLRYQKNCFQVTKYLTSDIQYPRTSHGVIHHNTTAIVEEMPQSLLLIIGILSKLSAFERRKAIRNTWMIKCKEIKGVLCVFFTDTIPGAKKLDEKDLIQMPIPPGVDFTKRLLTMYEWAVASYEFNYFLRVDDDYFLCMDHLNYDVMRRPRKGLYWGYVHCQPNIVRIDEGWMITSVDIIKEVLSKRNTTLLCHPYGDQAFAMWMKDSQLNITYFYDNERVIHSAAFGASLAYMQADVCDRVLGLHGTPPQKMYQYWNKTEYGGSQKKRISKETFIFPEIKHFNLSCLVPNILDWRQFGNSYRFEPKLCRFNPTWRTANGEYTGRGIK